MFIRDAERVRGGRRLDPARTLARGFGLLSLAVGGLEIAAPGRFARWLGLKKAHGPIVTGYGARELATGAALLAARSPHPFLWGRLAGSLLDVATLAIGFRRSRKRANLAIALGLAAAAAAVELALALQLARSARRTKGPVRDYSARSGFPLGPQHSHGAAARELKQGLDWRDIWRANQGRGSVAPLIELKGDGRRKPAAPGRRAGPPEGFPTGFI
jgi:hypothetical protein